LGTDVSCIAAPGVEGCAIDPQEQPRPGFQWSSTFEIEPEKLPDETTVAGACD
jgi:hypothetical protein